MSHTTKIVARMTHLKAFVTAWKMGASRVLTHPCWPANPDSQHCKAAGAAKLTGMGDEARRLLSAAAAPARPTAGARGPGGGSAPLAAAQCEGPPPPNGSWARQRIGTRPPDVKGALPSRNRRSIFGAARQVWFSDVTVCPGGKMKNPLRVVTRSLQERRKKGTRNPRNEQ